MDGLQATDDGQPALHARVVMDTARVAGVDPLELPPLLDAVDPEALDQLFARTNDAVRRGSIEFPYAGYTVTVEAGSETTITVE